MTLESTTEEAANSISDIQSRMEKLTKDQIAQELEVVRVRLLTPTYTLYEDQDNCSSDTQAYLEYPIK
mgnify:CR=1 FL=1